MITDERKNLAIIRADPEILVIVTAGAAAQVGERVPTIVRLHGDDTGCIQGVGIIRIHPHDSVITATDPQDRAGIIRRACKVMPPIVRAPQAQSCRGVVVTGIGGRHHRVESLRATRRNRHIDLRRVGWELVPKALPMLATVIRAVEAATRASILVTVFPRS